MTDHKNTILAIVLSLIVVVGWQYFVGYPQMEKQRQEAALKQQQQSQQPAQQPAKPSEAQQPGTPQTGAPPAPGTEPAAIAGQTLTREAVVAASPRIPVQTPRLQGTLALKGGRIDDLSLVKYRETVDPNSPAIVLLSPSGTPHPFYAEFGWVAAAGTTAKLPGPDTVWKQ